MGHIRDGLPFEVLVEVIAAHDAQSLDGTPETRIEQRITRCMELARRAGFNDLEVRLDRQDLGWLCAARHVDRYSHAARQLRVEGVLVARAGAEFESHIVGRWKTTSERAFPIIADPSQTPGFVQYVATDDEKANLLHKFQAYVLNQAVDSPASGQWN